jgi:DNA topoisomerase-3
MIMTSVSGHLLQLEFISQYKGWKSCLPEELFDAPVERTCSPDYEPIKRTLEKEVRACQKLIVWTDCDREGENIGFEIIQVCTAVKPNLDVFRATFSEITAPSVSRALSRLGRPNQLISDAVDVRSELDLKIGAAFTRLQTLRLQRAFPGKLSEKLISYGSCQFPTLGFVVERYKQREEFVSEPFWRICVFHERQANEKPVEFTWERVRLFDYNVCLAIYDLILTNPMAKVVEVKTKPKSKWRPCALDTIVSFSFSSS